MRGNRFGLALLAVQIPLALLLWWPVIERIWR